MENNQAIKNYEETRTKMGQALFEANINAFANKYCNEFFVRDFKTDKNIMVIGFTFEKEVVVEILDDTADLVMKTKSIPDAIKFIQTALELHYD